MSTLKADKLEDLNILIQGAVEKRLEHLLCNRFILADLGS